MKIEIRYGKILAINSCDVPFEVVNAQVFEAKHHTQIYQYQIGLLYMCVWFFFQGGQVRTAQRTLMHAHPALAIRFRTVSTSPLASTLLLTLGTHALSVLQGTSLKVEQCKTKQLCFIVTYYSQKCIFGRE